MKGNMSVMRAFLMGRDNVLVLGHRSRDSILSLFTFWCLGAESLGGNVDIK